MMISISMSSGAQSLKSYYAQSSNFSCQAYGIGPRSYERTSFGIYPEIQFIKSPVIGISASYAHLRDVEWTSWNRGVNLGFEFDPIQKFYGPKLSVWGDMFALFMGFNAGLSVMYYRQDNHGGLYLRPEIGLGLPRFHIKYGYGFKMTGNYVSGFQRHTITIGYHISLVNRYQKIKNPSIQ
jgi:hypothetical protein